MTVTNPEEEAQVRKAIDELTEALRTKNVDQISAAYAPETVMYVLAPPLQNVTGQNAPGAAGVREWLGSFRGPLGYDSRDLHMAVSGDLALAYRLIHISGTRTDGNATDLWVRETLGFRQLDGAWKIIHQHQSVPMYMDGSNKAAVDLKP
ncbi:nuclear transport factor 2 family protein [Hymenobacter sp. M29]|uniref:Nuclear transport factor 2 family protein n=1 Tax=Hymenobacter mellowenesis TaxID=3063995 RepID=A0ABT9AEG0_9BACT|nr:nuclear transport factor 2 family protein [Hymenobacter sp. M29]MDO7848199.1 nuclear transport factor 2 family protein [Hymenobacter sp. M29]